MNARTDRSGAPRPPVTTRRMRAIVQDTYGPPEVLRAAEIDRPTIAADEVLLEVAAAGVDRGVWHLMAGRPYLVRLGFGLTRPAVAVPGLDVAGRVVAVGSEVRRFRVGDEVFGIARGAYAQYAAAKASKLALRPAGLAVEQAAVATISGITALQALTDVGRLSAGQSVLVIGASGGVGSYAVQLAAALGATVTGVASGAKADLVRELGAHHVLDHGRDDYLDGSARYDLILDIGGLNPLRRLRRALTRTGTLVIVGGEGGGRWTGGIGRQIRATLLSTFVPQRLTFFLSAERQDVIQRLAGYLERGEVVPAVGRRYPLDQTSTALADLVAGHARGKSVILVKES
ncbi:NAD(P)-dependent alcohol dehydrogenase [Actinotalea sp.]|uniref:NAD(P)-dependent alcohol dehydrogenase n=1 Tax=Actinotalea sp. TaxID=1872145 RepID=UPI00356A291A